jgi:alkylation response protein AidB-like acyl-CoA dehydrogenase
MLSGEEMWCQLFSEPSAGSDLAGLLTRAERDGDEYVVNGQKIWTSLAHFARFGILLVRTDPGAERHSGITYLICPMDAPGIEIRPIVEMTGIHSFNEVFLTDVRIPVANRVGEENRGWELAKVTLANERVSLSTGGVLWGNGPTAYELIEAAGGKSGVTDPRARQRLATLWTEAKLLDLIRLRTLTSRIKGRPPGPEASIRKLLADLHGQHAMGLAVDLNGAAAMTPGGELSYGFLFSQALTIGGGTAEVQRDIIAERVLGLPRDRAGR